MRFCFKIGAMIACMVIVVACAAPPSEPAVEEPSTREADMAAINALTDRAEEALNGGDAAASVALYTDEAVSMIPNRPAAVGKEAISQAMHAALAANSYELSLSTEEVEVLGDWAFWRGSYSVTLTPSEGEPIEDKGKVLNILRRQPDGSWKIARHIRNSDLPIRSTEGQ